jgi:hypothetical protein
LAVALFEQAAEQQRMIAALRDYTDNHKLFEMVRGDSIL